MPNWLPSVWCSFTLPESKALGGTPLTKLTAVWPGLSGIWNWPLNTPAIALILLEASMILST